MYNILKWQFVKIRTKHHKINYKFVVKIQRNNSEFFVGTLIFIEIITSRRASVIQIYIHFDKNNKYTNTVYR